MLRRPRLLFGHLTPDTSSLALLLFPHSPEGGGDGGGGGAGGTGGGSGDGGGGTPPPPPPGPPAGDKGFPDNTAPESMTSDQQAAYWKFRSRQNEDRGRDALAWKAANETKVSDYDRLLAASQTDQEKAIAAATAKAAAEGRAELVPQLVAAEFFAAAKGALTREQVTDLLAPLDKTHFLDATGKVDTAKVTAWVEKVAPTAAGGAGGGGEGGGTGGGKRWPGTGGQGHRGGDGGGKTDVQSGRDLYARMKKPATTP